MVGSLGVHLLTGFVIFRGLLILEREPQKQPPPQELVWIELTEPAMHSSIRYPRGPKKKRVSTISHSSTQASESMLPTSESEHLPSASIEISPRQRYFREFREQVAEAAHRSVSQDLERGYRDELEISLVFTDFGELQTLEFKNIHHSNPISRRLRARLESLIPQIVQDLGRVPLVEGERLPEVRLQVRLGSVADIPI